MLRSRFQGELLAWLYLHPDDEYSATELAHRFMVSQSTVIAADVLADVEKVQRIRDAAAKVLDQMSPY